jgi:hypothetical protein
VREDVHQITADARHRALVAATCLGEVPQCGTKTEAKRRRTTCCRKPRSRSTCNCWRILSRTWQPAPMSFIGVVGMELFQFAGEMGSACVSRAAVGVPPNARCVRCSQRDVANGDRNGRASQSFQRDDPAGNGAGNGRANMAGSRAD